MPYSPLGNFVLVLTVGAMIVAVVLLRQQRAGKTDGIWLLGGLLGLLLGAAGVAGAIQIAGYELVHGDTYGTPPEVVPDDPDDAPDGVPTTSAPGMGGRGGGGPGMGGAGGGAPGMGGAGGFGPPQPSPKAELSETVRKLDLLTQGIALNLSAEQAANLKPVLQRIRAQESMSDEEAEKASEELTDMLDEGQQKKIAAVGVPRAAGGFGQRPEEGENPFSGGQNAVTLDALLDRVNSSGGQPKEDSDAKAKDGDAKAKDGDAKAKDSDAKAKDSESPEPPKTVGGNP